MFQAMDQSLATILDGGEIEVQINKEQSHVRITRALATPDLVAS